MASEVVGAEVAGVPSLQVYQDVYNSLTRKTETLVRFFFEKHIVSINDLQNLHSFLEQAVEQYQVNASSCSVVVRYADGKSERFSSFGRFTTLGLQRTIPCVDIEIEYNFLILLPKSQEAKPYKVEVGLRSGVGIIESFKITNATETEQAMYFDLHSGTARLDISYVDLAVARALQATIEDWYKSLRKQGQNRVWSILRKYSNFLIAGARVLCIWITLVLFLKFSEDSFFGSSNLFEALISLSAAVISVYILSQPLLGLLRKTLDRSVTSSIVILGPADQDLFDRQAATLGRAAIKMVASGLASIVLGVLSAWLAVKLGIK